MNQSYKKCVSRPHSAQNVCAARKSRKGRENGTESESVSYFCHSGPLPQHFRRGQGALHQPARHQQGHFPAGAEPEHHAFSALQPGREADRGRGASLPAGGKRFLRHQPGRTAAEKNAGARHGASVHRGQQHPLQICAPALSSHLYGRKPAHSDLHLLSVHLADGAGAGKRFCGYRTDRRKRPHGQALLLSGSGDRGYFCLRRELSVQPEGARRPLRVRFRPGHPGRVHPDAPGQGEHHPPVHGQISGAGGDRDRSDPGGHLHGSAH